MRPVIGITPDVGQTSPRPGRPALPRYELKQAYADAVLARADCPSSSRTARTRRRRRRRWSCATAS